MSSDITNGAMTPISGTVEYLHSGEGGAHDVADISPEKKTKKKQKYKRGQLSNYMIRYGI